jgi:methyl-accepting chemotaxis protein
MVSISTSLRQAEPVDVLVHERREQFALNFTKYIAMGSGMLAAGVFVIWLFFQQHTQMLPAAFLLANMTVWMALYPAFRARGYAGLGALLAIGSLLLTSAGCFFLLPEAKLGAVGGFFIAVLVANMISGRRGGGWIIALSLFLLVVSILLTDSIHPEWFVPLDRNLGLILTLFIAVVPFFVASLITFLNNVEQERYFRESKLAGLEIEQRILAEQKQREQMQQTSLELEQSAETERGQRERLSEVLAQVRSAANDLNSAAAEILSATTQQVAGASEQSSAIAQTTTTVDEVKVIAEQAAARSQEVANSSQRALDVSQVGNHAVQDTIESMNQIKRRVEDIAQNILELSEQTQQIGEIIATVNEIADQSNMLALNASVEAARAGEHGKSFAVVAAEVRSLAEQSRAATIQVKRIIAEIQKATNSSVMATEEGTKGVDLGVQRVLEAREAIGKLGTVITDNAQMAVQVLGGGRQQQTGIEQIAHAMQTINQTTMQNLNSVRQAEKAAQNLNLLAKKLMETVER